MQLKTKMFLEQQIPQTNLILPENLKLKCRSIMSNQMDFMAKEFDLLQADCDENLTAENACLNMFGDTENLSDKLSSVMLNAEYILTEYDIIC